MTIENFMSLVSYSIAIFALGYMLGKDFNNKRK